MCFMQTVLHGCWHTKTLRKVFLAADLSEENLPSRNTATIEALGNFIQAAGNQDVKLEDPIDGRPVYEALTADNFIAADQFDDAPMVFNKIISAARDWVVEKGHEDALPLFQATISLQVILGEEVKDIEDIYPETYSVPYSKLMETYQQGMSLDDFNLNGIVGALTTIAGQ